MSSEDVPAAKSVTIRRLVAEVVADLQAAGVSLNRLVSARLSR